MEKEHALSDTDFLGVANDEKGASHCQQRFLQIAGYTLTSYVNPLNIYAILICPKLRSKTWDTVQKGKSDWYVKTTQRRGYY